MMEDLCAGIRWLMMKDFALELHNSNWELDIFLWKPFALELGNSN